MVPSVKSLPPAAVFVSATAGVALALAAGAYWLGAPDGAPALATGDGHGCAPTLARAGLPNAWTVVEAPDALALDRVESRWTLQNGSTTGWHALALYLDGEEGVGFADADASGTLTRGDAFTLSGVAGDDARATLPSAEFRCGAATSSVA